ncbi:uncharacterized protein DS421_16g542980 [Arachis hypogaea]|nr:uncharacterized protein DS421_16g542980 [Arachis hypogaea]
MVTEKPFCHRSCPETPSESDSATAGVLRPPELPPEVLATSAVAGKVAVDLPELLAAAEAVAGRFKIAAASCCYSGKKLCFEKSRVSLRLCWLMNMSFGNVGSSPDYYMLRLELLWLLQKWLGAEVLVAVSSG